MQGGNDGHERSEEDRGALNLKGGNKRRRRERNARLKKKKNDIYSKCFRRHIHI